MPTLNLPTAAGTIASYTTRPPKTFPKADKPFNRVAYAAAHVVADPLADGDPWLDTKIDWERTIAFRRHLWSLGLGVAEPTPAWGLMLRGAGTQFLERAPWLAIAPGLAISAAVFGFNLFGDSLRDALDPKLRGT